MLYLLIAVLVFGGILLWNRRRWPQRGCRWREDRAGARGALMRYSCVTCGAEAYRSTGAPDRCLAGLDKPRL